MTACISCDAPRDFLYHFSLPDQTEPLPVGHGHGDRDQDDDNMKGGEFYDLPVSEHFSLGSLEEAQVECVLVWQEKGVGRIQQDQSGNKGANIALGENGLDRQHPDQQGRRDGQSESEQVSRQGNRHKKQEFVTGKISEAGVCPRCDEGGQTARRHHISKPHEGTKGNQEIPVDIRADRLFIEHGASKQDKKAEHRYPCAVDPVPGLGHKACEGYNNCEKGYFFMGSHGAESFQLGVDDLRIHSYLLFGAIEQNDRKIGEEEEGDSHGEY